MKHTKSTANDMTKRRIGAHVSVAGGLFNAIERAEKIGANCLQIFSSPPQQWQGSRYEEEEIKLFRNKVISLDLLPVFIHGVYLINLASDNEFIRQKSIEALVLDLNFASQIGAAGVIFHLGSHALGWSGEKRKELLKTFQTILNKSPKDSIIIVENAADSGVKIGSRLEDLEKIKEDLNSNRIKFCLDTAHAFASGYDLRTEERVNDYINSVGRLVGWENVAAIHINDSKVDLGKKSDRHENIGAGKIGLDGFKFFLNHSKLIDKPFILETPGFKNEGPDKQNIQILRNLLSHQIN